MAKLKEMLGERVISGFRGTLDFYYYMGIPCVRSWPKSPGKARSAAVQAQWPVFTQAAYLSKQLPPEIIDAYRAMAQSSGLSWKDVFTRSYMSGWKKLIATVDELE